MRLGNLYVLLRAGPFLIAVGTVLFVITFAAQIITGIAIAVIFATIVALLGVVAFKVLLKLLGWLECWTILRHEREFLAALDAERRAKIKAASRAGDAYTLRVLLTEARRASVRYRFS
jgi:hypothetical protein